MGAQAPVFAGRAGDAGDKQGVVCGEGEGGQAQTLTSKRAGGRQERGRKRRRPDPEDSRPNNHNGHNDVADREEPAADSAQGGQERVSRVAREYRDPRSAWIKHLQRYFQHRNQAGDAVFVRCSTLAFAGLADLPSDKTQDATMPVRKCEAT